MFPQALHLAVFRAPHEVHAFQDFCTEQLAKVKGKERDPVLLVLRQQIMKYLDAIPTFKAITGEAFERDHWRTLFGLLKLGAQPPTARERDRRREKSYM